MDDCSEFRATRGQLAEALEHWEAMANGMGWPQRDDSDRFRDAADYLIGLLNGEAVAA